MLCFHIPDNSLFEIFIYVLVDVWERHITLETLRQTLRQINVYIFSKKEQLVNL